MVFRGWQICSSEVLREGGVLGVDGNGGWRGNRGWPVAVEVTGDLLRGLRGERMGEGWSVSLRWLGLVRGGGEGLGGGRRVAMVLRGENGGSGSLIDSVKDLWRPRLQEDIDGCGKLEAKGKSNQVD